MRPVLRHEFFTSYYCLQGASLLQSVKVPPHLLVEKGSRNEGLGSRRMRPARPKKLLGLFEAVQVRFLTFPGHLHICFISQTQIRIHVSENGLKNTFRPKLRLRSILRKDDNKIFRLNFPVKTSFIGLRIASDLLCSCAARSDISIDSAPCS